MKSLKLKATVSTLTILVICVLGRLFNLYDTRFTFNFFVMLLALLQTIFIVWNLIRQYKKGSKKEVKDLLKSFLVYFGVMAVFVMLNYWFHFYGTLRQSIFFCLWMYVAMLPISWLATKIQKFLKGKSVKRNEI